MYLVIGFQDDQCGEFVAQGLRDRAHDVLVVDQPLGGGANFSWLQTNAGGESRLEFSGGPNFSSKDLRGVLVRPSAAHLAESESHAALYGWLASLTCAVVSRPPPWLWFAMHHPTLEWSPVLRPHDLAVPAAIITADPRAARAFGDRWNRQVTYQPITSTSRYAIASDREWHELEKIMAVVPVTLYEPTFGVPFFAAAVGKELIWSATISASTERERLATSISSLGRALGIDAFEVEMMMASSGPVCLGVTPFPDLSHYAAAERERIVDGLVALLAPP